MILRSGVAIIARNLFASLNITAQAPAHTMRDSRNLGSDM
jgi:hypothetical protein